MVTLVQENMEEEFGSGGEGGIAIAGNVSLYNSTSLTVTGGNGGVASSTGSSNTTSGTSKGGDGGTAINGNVSIADNCKLIVNCSNGGKGGLAQISRGGNAGSGIIGDVSLGKNIVLIVKLGKYGVANTSASSTYQGQPGYEIITSVIPTIDGGYIKTLFYDSSKQLIVPVDSSNNNLYFTRIVPNIGGKLIPNEELQIVSDDFNYSTRTDENGDIYCYLPTAIEMELEYDNYFATLSQVWEDNNNTMYLTMDYKIDDPSGVLGDLNNDNTRNIIDVRVLLQKVIANQTGNWTEAELTVGDMNKDKTIDIIDVRILLAKVIAES